jgi:hypothetical protein
MDEILEALESDSVVRILDVRSSAAGQLRLLAVELRHQTAMTDRLIRLCSEHGLDDQVGQALFPMTTKEEV